MLSQTDTVPTVPLPEAPKAKRRLLTVIGVVILVLAVTSIVAAANGIIIGNGTVLKPNANLTIPLLASDCQSTTNCGDQACLESDNVTSAGVEVNNKCYVPLFDTTDY